MISPLSSYSGDGSVSSRKPHPLALGTLKYPGMRYLGRCGRLPWKPVPKVTLSGSDPRGLELPFVKGGDRVGGCHKLRPDVFRMSGWTSGCDPKFLLDAGGGCFDRRTLGEFVPEVPRSDPVRRRRVRVDSTALDGDPVGVMLRGSTFPCRITMGGPSRRASGGILPFHPCPDDRLKDPSCLRRTESRGVDRSGGRCGFRLFLGDLYRAGGPGGAPGRRRRRPIPTGEESLNWDRGHGSLSDDGDVLWRMSMGPKYGVRVGPDPPPGFSPKDPGYRLGVGLLCKWQCRDITVDFTADLALQNKDPLRPLHPRHPSPDPHPSPVVSNPFLSPYLTSFVYVLNSRSDP